MKLLRKLVIFVIVFNLFTIVCSATTVSSRITVLKSSTEVTSICSQANTSVGLNASGKKIMSYTSSNGALSFNNARYYKLTAEQKETFMETALLATKNSGLGKQQKNRIYNFIEEQDTTITAAMKYLKSDTSADFVEARNWFRPFSGPISTIMGFLCILINVFIALSMVFDIAYLVLPGMQLILEHGEPHKQPFGVSIEAWKTNREVQNISEKSGILTLYLKKRGPAIFIVCLCLSYLISGKIYDLFVYFMYAFSIM